MNINLYSSPFVSSFLSSVHCARAISGPHADRDELDDFPWPKETMEAQDVLFNQSILVASTCSA